MQHGIIGLKDEDFWKSLSEEEKNKVINNLIDSNMNGIVIDAPQKVNTTKYSTIPIYGFRKSSGYESYHYRLESSLLAYAFSANSGKFYCKEAFYQKESPTPIIPKPESAFLKGFTLGDFFFDLKERIPELVFQEDEIEVGVLLFDKKSNSLKITLSENSDKKTTIDTDKIPIGNFEFLKKYQVEENNLVSESMELSCNRELYSLNNHENIDFVMRFNFGTNQMYDLLHPIKIDTDNIVNSTMTEKIIRIYLVFIGYDVTGPWVSMLDIPVQEGNVDVYKGIAIFNLSDVVPLIPQRYVAWAFTKNCMAGPLYFSSVAE